MGNTYSQTFPPTARFTEKNLLDQAGKVFIVTGSSSGVGKELAQILYSHNAKEAFPNSKGELVHLHLDLDDLSTIKKSAEEFLSKEQRLDVLWNNAGVMVPPHGSKTKQGYELQLGTNNVAPFLFTKLLTPVLLKSAKESAPGAVRVVWVSSSGAETLSPEGGIDMGNLDYNVDKSTWNKYGISKAGNIFHSTEFAKRYGNQGVISVALNPGNLRTDLQRNTPRWQLLLLGWLLYTPIHGAYTELFAGLSPDVTPEKNGAWIIPWGRIGNLRKDIAEGSKTAAEGGTGIAAAFWGWSEEQVKAYL
ncbi:hypothetical protein BKA65DRAFT_561849 [Rhexocercosporidium sp. MPI-PUGE-AT-0058]|nr:hypothetical protein BKA65DRAFT_561849 [Rhexocercosporidium sp. MPI-PUGE-AT-0058]